MLGNFYQVLGKRVMTLFLLIFFSLSFSMHGFAAPDPTPTKDTNSGSLDTRTWNKSPNAGEILENLTSQVDPLMRLVTAIAYVMGMYLIVMGIVKLKQYGEARTQMSGQHHLKEPMAFLVIGALLLYLPTSVQVGLSTFWTDPTPYAYKTDTNQWTTLFKSVFLVVQLFGTIALVRGLLMLSKAGGGHGQPGSFAKGVTHVIAGLLCINLYGLVTVILVTLGFLK